MYPQKRDNSLIINGVGLSKNIFSVECIFHEGFFGMTDVMQYDCALIVHKITCN